MKLPINSTENGDYDVEYHIYVPLSKLLFDNQTYWDDRFNYSKCNVTNRCNMSDNRTDTSTSYSSSTEEGVIEEMGCFDPVHGQVLMNHSCSNIMNISDSKSESYLQNAYCTCNNNSWTHYVNDTVSYMEDNDTIYNAYKHPILTPCGQSVLVCKLFQNYVKMRMGAYFGV